MPRARGGAYYTVLQRVLKLCSMADVGEVSLGAAGWKRRGPLLRRVVSGLSQAVTSNPMLKCDRLHGHHPFMATILSASLQRHPSVGGCAPTSPLHYGW